MLHKDTYSIDTGGNRINYNANDFVISCDYD